MKLRFMIEDGREYGGPASGLGFDCIGEVATCHYKWTVERKAYGTQEAYEETREYKSEFRYVTVNSLEGLLGLHMKVLHWTRSKWPKGIVRHEPNMILIASNDYSHKREHLVDGVHMPSQIIRFWEITD